MAVRPFKEKLLVKGCLRLLDAYFREIELFQAREVLLLFEKL